MLDPVIDTSDPTMNESTVFCSWSLQFHGHVSKPYVHKTLRVPVWKNTQTKEAVASAPSMPVGMGGSTRSRLSFMTAFEKNLPSQL